MAQFRYVAKSRTGERQEGSLEAPDKRAVIAQLGRLGFVPISVVETSARETPPPAAEKPKGAAKPSTSPAPAAKAAPAGSARKWFRFEKSVRSRSRLKMGDLLLFTGELSDLLASGMTLGSALHVGACGAQVRRTRSRVVGGDDDLVARFDVAEAGGRRGSCGVQQRGGQ